MNAKIKHDVHGAKLEGATQGTNHFCPLFLSRPLFFAAEPPQENIMWGWIVCCRPVQTSSFFEQTPALSAQYAPEHDYNHLMEEPTAAEEMERDLSLGDLLESALTRTYPHNDSLMLLSSIGAHQFQAFKANWVQAALKHKMPCTATHEAGLTMHEAYLLQHLQQGSGVSQWESNSQTDPNSGVEVVADRRQSRSSRLAMASSAHHSLCAGADTSSWQQSSRNPAAASSTVAAGVGSTHTADSEPQPVEDWPTDWLIFAEPPDCPVDSALIWAAADNSTCTHSSRASSAACHPS